MERIADVAYTGASAAGAGTRKRAGAGSGGSSGSYMDSSSGGGGGSSGGMGSFDPYAHNTGTLAAPLPSYASDQFASSRGNAVPQMQGQMQNAVSGAPPPSLNQRKRE